MLRVYCNLGDFGLLWFYCGAMLGVLFFVVCFLVADVVVGVVCYF